ncbi:DUF4440 domain-containing protein [Pseudomonas sp. IT-P176]|uniref:nuclear transport factor 2 family protein n=1 Tax=Pseudomonas sp. IT-P176 TaxID=3026444 RepID=UPI0039E14607
MDLSQTLLQLEQRLLSQGIRRDAQELSSLIADDFREFGASGGTWTKADLIEQLPQQAFVQRTISQFAVKPLSEHTALVTYHCHNTQADSLRSSIWRKQDEHWQMLFHQGTHIPTPL